MKFGEAFAEKYDLSTLKVLGTVGEPINPEAWLWYHKYVGSENCSVVDTYWQVSRLYFMFVITAIGIRIFVLFYLTLNAFSYTYLRLRLEGT